MSFTYAAARLTASFLAVAALAPANPAQAANGIKSAYVEEVIPAKSFYDSMGVTNAISAVGPGTGVLGVSNLVITNYDTSAQQVFIFNPLTTGGACNTATVVGGGTPRMEIYVQPQSTLVIPYPQPLVFNPLSGNTCIGAEVTTVLHGGSVEIDVTGFVN